MASAFSHPAVLLGLSPWFRRVGLDRRALLLGAFCSVLPDVDAVGFWLGVPYDAPLGHRGLTHSILFAAAVAAALVLLAFATSTSPRAVFLFLFLCGVSHGVLDAMTDGGRGIAFFAPLDNGRYFFPWRPIHVSPIGVDGLFGRRGLVIAESELLWIWLPSLLVGAIGLIAWRRRRTVSREVKSPGFGKDRWK